MLLKYNTKIAFMFEFQHDSYMKIVKLQLTKVFQLFHPYIHGKLVAIVIQFSIGGHIHI